jgi:flagellar biosynthesis/type III secretory pathway protein FliH
VAAEEKKSLPSNERRLSPNRQTGFRLHYFPDIPVDGQLGVRRCGPAHDKFQRTQYDSNDPACLDDAAGIDERRSLARQAALTADEREEQAYRKGFAEGKAQGLNDGQETGFELGTKKIEPLISAIKEALIQLNAIREETYLQLEKEVVELAIAIAQKVICREIATDKETVVCVAKEALAKDLIPDVNNVTFEAEENIQSGGCIIETELGEIDARIEKQLQAVKESFLSTMENGDNKDKHRTSNVQHRTLNGND